MDTYFARPQRKQKEELSLDIERVSRSALVTGLLHTINGVLAVVNSERQVVACNDSFMKAMGIATPQEKLGLRPGEMLDCIHAHKKPAGCGTTRFCPSCGAAVAMVSSLAENAPKEQTCALRAVRGEKEIDIVFSVRAQPLQIENEKFLLLFLQDITRQQQLAAFEQAFFHDISNMLCMVVGGSELLAAESPSPLVQQMRRSVLRLQHEISIQRYLTENMSGTYALTREQTTVGMLYTELRSLYNGHPLSRDRHLVFSGENEETALNTDISITLRILCNMLTNAFEATAEGGTVELWSTKHNNTLSFSVWNAAVIPENIQHRIFQRNFSTKKQLGRGIGTFSMKLLGEHLLGGAVTFSSSSGNGTIFTLSLPLSHGL
ncbi:MAG: sensor histidine kinase [Desulfopila sp.]|nr:sensor histidine kinase [Desulfopila sp.]